MNLAHDLTELEHRLAYPTSVSAGGQTPLELLREMRSRLGHFARRFGVEDELGVTVKLEDGRTIYWPADDLSRLAPSVVCGILQRIQELRRVIAQMEAEGQQPAAILRHISREIPYEDLWLSGNAEKVHNAMLATGIPSEPRQIHAPFEQVIRKGLMAGLKLGEQCKLNPTAYVRELNEALALLDQCMPVEDSPFIEQLARAQGPNRRHAIDPVLVREQTRHKIEELFDTKASRVKAAHHNRIDWTNHPERWNKEPSTPEQISRIYDEFIQREQMLYSTVRVIERPDHHEKRFILVYGDEDDMTVEHGTGPFESYDSAAAWYLSGNR